VKSPEKMISEESLPSKSRSLRAKSIAKRLATEKNKNEAKPSHNSKGTNLKKRSSSSSSKHHTMSKYRRKVANAKERERMKLVSEAFDKLSNVVPVYKMMTTPPDPNLDLDLENKNPVTKVSTLRCAISYINSLQRLIEDANRGVLDPSLYSLNEEEEEDLGESLPVSNTPPPKKPGKSSKTSTKGKKKKKNEHGKKNGKKSYENGLKKTAKNNNNNGHVSKKGGSFKVRQYHASDFSARIPLSKNKPAYKPMSKAQLNLAIAKGLQNCKPIYTPPPPTTKKLSVNTQNQLNHQNSVNFTTPNSAPLQLIQLRPLSDFQTVLATTEDDYSNLAPNLEVFLQQPDLSPSTSPMSTSSASMASPNSSPNSSIMASSPAGSSSGTSSGTESCFATILEETHILDDIQAVLMDADNFDILV